MASSNIQIECSICMDNFNNSTRRPRGLPCLHHFCTPCLQRCIIQGRITCSVCRREYIIDNIEEVPINNMLENIIEMYLQMSSNSIHPNNSSDEEESFSNGQCSKHRNCLCFFRCITHGIYICRECTVVQHPITKCHIIEIKEQIMKEREDTLNDAQKCIVHLDEITSNLETIVVEKNANITSKQAQVQDILQQIEEDKKTCDEVEQKISENKSISRQLEVQIRSLRSATTKNKLTKESLELQEKVRSLKKLLNELDENYDNEDFSKILLKISSLMSILGTQPVVYLDLEAAGRPLGRLRIQVTCGPRRKEQMLRLCANQDGNTYKGTCFGHAGCVGQPGECISSSNYLSDDGRSSSRAAVVQDLEQAECDVFVAGCDVFVAGAVAGCSDDGAMFTICTTTKASHTAMWPELGRVVQGLDMLSKAIRQYGTDIDGWSYDASSIKISQCGIEISS